MGIQMKPGESIDDFMIRRRAELKSGATPTTPANFDNVQSGSSTNSPVIEEDQRSSFEKFAHNMYVGQRNRREERATDPDQRGSFEKFAHGLYVSRRDKQEEDAALFEADPGEYLKQYGGDATRVSSALGGPATKGANIIKGTGNLVRRGIKSRATGEAVAKKTGIVAAKTTPQGLSKGSLADELVELSDEATDLAGVIRGRVKTFEDAQAAGAKVWSKASLATKTPDEFGRILKEIPDELMDDFFQGAGAKLVQSVRDMPRLTSTAQASLLSPSGRNVLKHTLKGMDDVEFDKLMIMLEKGLWTEARNKILKWAVVLPALGYVGLRQFLPSN